MAVPVHASGGSTFGNPTKLFDARSYYFAPPNRTYDVTSRQSYPRSGACCWRNLLSSAARQTRVA
jgi:hypothetical protein